MLQTTNLLSKFQCDIAEKAVEMLKDTFGTSLQIFIGHRFNDNAVNLEFSINSIKYTIKIYNDDNLIVCGIHSYTYKKVTYEDENLFLLASERNVLYAHKECLQKFIENIINDNYFYVRFIIAQLVDLKNLVNLDDNCQKSFLNKTVTFITKE